MEINERNLIPPPHGQFYICGWKKCRPVRVDITYVTSSLIGWGLAQSWIERVLWSSYLILSYLIHCRDCFVKYRQWVEVFSWQHLELLFRWSRPRIFEKCVDKRTMALMSMCYLLWCPVQLFRPRVYPANIIRNKYVIITSKRCFDVIITYLLRSSSAGYVFWTRSHTCYSKYEWMSTII